VSRGGAAQGGDEVEVGGDGVEEGGRLRRGVELCRWGPRRLGWERPRYPRNAARRPLCCKLQDLLQLLLEPLQYAFDLHFADADAYTASAGDSLTHR
jgi:hypothetical protein